MQDGGVTAWPYKVSTRAAVKAHAHTPHSEIFHEKYLNEPGLLSSSFWESVPYGKVHVFESLDEEKKKKKRKVHVPECLHKVSPNVQ